MKTNKRIQSIIKKMMDSVYHIDAMSPEFKAANAELLKAIKMNDKSGAIPHADLEAINKAMKANDGKQAAELLKKVQLKLSKAEKALDDAVKESLQRLSETKKESESASLKLKETKAIAPLFEKAKSIADNVKTNPANIKKLSAIAPKIKAYSDINDKLNKITDLVNKGKDASKQIDMLKRAIETAEKKYKKDYAAIEKAAKSAKDKLEVHSMQSKITQGKKDAFQKERLYLANAVKQIPDASMMQDIPEREQKIREENREKREKAEKELRSYIDQIGNAGVLARQQLDKKRSEMREHKTIRGYADEKISGLVHESYMKYREMFDNDPEHQDTIKDLDIIRIMARRGGIYEVQARMESMGNNDKILKKLFVKPLNFIKKVDKENEQLINGDYNGFKYHTADICSSKSPLYSAASVIVSEPSVSSRVKNLLKQIGGVSVGAFVSNLRQNYFRPYI